MKRHKDFIITTDKDFEGYTTFMNSVIENMKKDHETGIDFKNEINDNKVRIIEQAHAFEKEAFDNNHAFKLKDLHFEIEVLQDANANRSQQEVSLDGMLVYNCEWFIQ